MKLIVHDNGRIINVLNERLDEAEYHSHSKAGDLMFSLAKMYPDELILWCDERYLEHFDLSTLAGIFKHRRIMASYDFDKRSYMPSQIGYVEDSPFLTIKHEVEYPTWLMSSDVGGIYASVLNRAYSVKFQNKNFTYFLNSLAKSLMNEGLFCYSTPLFVKALPSEIAIGKVANTRTLFRFVKEHYKTQWIFVLLFSFLFFEKRFPLLPFLGALRFQKKRVEENLLSEIEVDASTNHSVEKNIDVIIPTMGRKDCLHDVLLDLSKQTILPSKVIVIEQNEDETTKSELDYLQSKAWPFEIKHHFIHQTGACNARNMALRDVTSNWVFMADDDIRFTKTLFEDVFDFLMTYGAKAVTLSCLQEGEVEQEITNKQWVSFGSGCSVVASEVAKSTYYDMAYEFGFGEDKQYGMDLRRNGCDIHFNPFVKLLHLKAPLGGFRKPIKKAWDADEITPKPAPTVLLYYLKNATEEQTNRYKLQLFLKYYGKQDVKNPFAYLKKMKRSWNSGLTWAQKLSDS